MHLRTLLRVPLKAFQYLWFCESRWRNVLLAHAGCHSPRLLCRVLHRLAQPSQFSDSIISYILISYILIRTPLKHAASDCITFVQFSVRANHVFVFVRVGDDALHPARHYNWTVHYVSMRWGELVLQKCSKFIRLNTCESWDSDWVTVWPTEESWFVSQQG